MKKNYPDPDYPFEYSESPRSGNEINGLGEQARRRAIQIFHGSGARQLEWQALEQFFALTAPFKVYWLNLLNRWILRNADGAVAKQQCSTDAPEALLHSIKQKALELGAGTVGVTRVGEEALYQNYDCKFKYAVVVMMPMDHEEMSHIAGIRSGIETMRVYMEITKTAIGLAKHIRNLGWPARAYGESADILHIPLAISAGLGQLGKHGSLICKEFGSNMRIATVLTNLPLLVDEPEDIGVHDLCIGCRRCTIDCPPNAISDKKQLVRGIEKWYVDFDKCAPYFTHTVGCGICIEVCPWSKPDRGPSLSEKLLSKRITNSTHTR